MESTTTTHVGSSESAMDSMQDKRIGTATAVAAEGSAVAPSTAEPVSSETSVEGGMPPPASACGPDTNDKPQITAAHEQKHDYPPDVQASIGIEHGGSPAADAIAPVVAPPSDAQTATPGPELVPSASQSSENGQAQACEQPPLSETPGQQAKHVQHVEQSEKEYATLEPHGLPAITTPIDNHYMYLFFRFCAERQKMQHLRDAGVPRDQLTEDETMKKEHIGNVYRELDAGSKRMKEVIIANGDQSNEEICFRVFLYCGFYMQSTWEALIEGLGEIPNWKNFNRDFHKYESIIYTKSVVRREVIYTSGFQLVPPTIYFGRNLPHFAATLRFVKALMESGLPERLRKCVYAVDASHILQTAPTLGGFLSLNILCYLNGSPHMKFFYRNFATCGPGSRYFLQRMFGKAAINSVAMEAAGLKWLYDNQWTYWARLGEAPPHAWTIGIRPGMRVLDFENALCWAHRYVNAYLKKGYRSFADLDPPEYDPEVAASSSMPAWCDEERYAWNDSRPAFVGDYDEEALKGQQEEQRRQEEEAEDVYEVEKIVCRKGNRSDKNGLFRVRWKGYPPEEDTWERASSLVEGADEALHDWLAWEEAVWGAIASITREMPYQRPDAAPTLKMETEGGEIVSDNRTPTRTRSRRGERDQPTRISKRAKTEIKVES